MQNGWETRAERVGEVDFRAGATAGGQFLLQENRVNTRTDANKPAVLLSRTTNNQNTRNALRSLVEHEMLAEFWTTVAWNSKSGWNRLLPRSVQMRLARRSVSEAPATRVRSVPWRELVRQSVRGTPAAGLLCSGERPFSVVGMNMHFDASVARRIRKLRPDIVYAYEGAALQTFREAKKQGITTIDEQSSSYSKWTLKLLGEEAERNPEFADLLPTLKDSREHLEWKDEELRLADYVFVPSDHVRSTLAGVVPDEKIRVISYGAPAVKPRAQCNLDSSRPLKVLFVGNLGQHKGIGYLLKAMDVLGGQAELMLVGRRLSPNAKVDEACRRWRWYDNLPHAEVLNAMQQADVLVLPSLSEGCALVVLEALACGLPVVVTPNTGSLAFVRDGREGFVVPICQAEAIAERLEAFHRDREMLAEMSRQAQVTAAENSWENYRANLAGLVGSLAWH
jgi:alpha-maltose-1-phosphate synthase